MNEDKRIVLAADHGGFKLKEKLKQALVKAGYEVTDVGTNSEQSVDYPDVVSLAAEKVSKNEIPRGVVICGTGIGASIVANKFPNVRAALISTNKITALSREHNDTNILALGGRFTPFAKARNILMTWLKTPFSGQERHARRIKEIKELEKKIILKALPVFILFSLLCGTYRLFAKTWSWSSTELDNLEKRNVILEKTSDITVLRPSWDKPVADEQFELFLDFNSPDETKDKTGHYAITREKLYRNGNIKFRGKNPGGFVFPGDVLCLDVKPTDFLNNRKDLESFTLSFWLRPLFLSGERPVITKGVYSENKFHGLKVFQSGRKLVFLFSNMFFNTTNTPYSFEFHNGPDLDIEQWRNYCISFDKTSGKLALYSDGEEVSVEWATITHAPESEILTPRFTDSSSLLTIGGETPFGYLGDLFITRNYVDKPQYSSMTVKDQPEVLTDVLENTFNNSKIHEVNLNNGTDSDRFDVFVRISQQPFDPFSVKPFWQSFPGSAQTSPVDALSGRFFQVKIAFKDSPSEETSSKIYSLKIDTEDMPDIAPPSLVTLSVTNSSLKVEWNKPMDRRIKGYLVYVKDSRNWSTKIDAGDTSSILVPDMKDKQGYTIQVSSYDDAVPPNESVLSREQKIMFIRSDLH